MSTLKNLFLLRPICIIFSIGDGGDFMVVRVLKLGIFCLLVLGVVPAQAKYPRPLFDKPIKLDDSGRPFVNSWQKQEHQRQMRVNNRQSGGIKKVGGPGPNGPPGSGPPPTPTSAATNRPEVQQIGPPPSTVPPPSEKQDFNF